MAFIFCFLCLPLLLFLQQNLVSSEAAKTIKQACLVCSFTVWIQPQLHPSNLHTNLPAFCLQSLAFFENFFMCIAINLIWTALTLLTMPIAMTEVVSRPLVDRGAGVQQEAKVRTYRREEPLIISASTACITYYYIKSRFAHAGQKCKSILWKFHGCLKTSKLN